MFPHLKISKEIRSTESILAVKRRTAQPAIREGVPGAVLVNDAGETDKAARIAQAAFAEDQVIYPGPSFLASEDFAFMLQKKKGTYCFLGSGPGKMVHHLEYHFNQDILPVGAAYWVALTESYLR